MSNAIASVGTAFQRSDGASAGGTYSAIAEINSITGPGMTRNFIEVTSLDSTGGYREFIGGFRDGGDVTLNMNFTRAGYDAMIDDYESADSVDYKIVFADDNNTEVSFAAFVTDLPLSVTVEDKVTLDITMKVTGQVTVDSGS